MAFGILLVVAFVVGLPIAVFAALVRAKENERELLATRSMLRDLAKTVDRLRSEVEQLKSAPPVAAADLQPAAEEKRSTDVGAAEATRAPAVTEQPVAREPAVAPEMKAAFAAAPSAGIKIETIEEALTSRWLVWLGAVSIALGGTFLVKYAIDQGLLGPTARVTLGFVLGVALAIGGEWLRQRPLQRAIATIRPNHVPPALSASGVFVAFASLYAAYGLYGLLPPVVAFAGLAAVALVAVGLSLLQGRFVALLGVLGSFLTPALVMTPNPSAWGFAVYLLIVEAACLAVARYQAWWWFGFATLAGAAIWPVLWMSGQWTSGDEWPFGFYLLITAVGFFVAPPRAEPTEGAHDWLRDWDWERLDAPARLVWIAAGVIIAALYLMVRVSQYSVPALVFFGAGIVLSLIAGRREARFEGFAIAAAAATLFMLAGMPVPNTVVAPPALPGAPFIPPELSFFAETNFAFGALFAVAGFVALWGAKRPAIWAGISAATPVLLLVIAYDRVVDFHVDLAWSALALALAVPNLFAAERVERYRAARGLEISLGFYAAAVTACLSLAAAMSIREAWLTVALAVELPVLGLIGKRVTGKSIPVIAGIVAGIVLVRLLFNYNIFQYPLSSHLGVSWIVYGYGIPAVAFFAAARLFRNVKPLVVVLKAGGLAFSVLLVSLQIRVFIAGALNAPSYGLLEQSLQSIAWLSIGAGLALHHRRSEDLVSSYGSRILLTVAAAQIVLLQLLVSNPLFSREFVGQYPLLNVLFLAYAVPAVFAFCVAMSEQTRDEMLARISAVAGFVLVFVYISLEVRRAYQGPFLVVSAPSDAEMYAYSAVWLCYAGILLGLGISLKQTLLRHAAIAVLLIAVLKVFLFDMAGLTGLYRVISFLGLGLSLVGIGYLYQRFVFRPAGSSVAAR